MKTYYANGVVQDDSSHLSPRIELTNKEIRASTEHYARTRLSHALHNSDLPKLHPKAIYKMLRRVKFTTYKIEYT